MGFQAAKPIEAKSVGPTISAGVRRRTSGPSKVTIFCNRDFIDAYFAGAKPGAMFKVSYGTDDNKGQIMLFPHADGDVELRAYSKHGGCSLSMSAWRGITNAEYKTAACKVLEQAGAGVVIQAPWEAT